MAGSTLHTKRDGATLTEAPGAQPRSVTQAELKRLATVKLDAAQGRAFARRIDASGRSVEARAMAAEIEKDGKLVIRLPIEQALEIAVAVHQAGGNGACEGAEPYYKAVLAADPAHARARHLYGVLLHKAGRKKEAMTHIRKAVAPLSGQPWMWNNLGLVHRESGDLAEAETCFHKALALNENYPEGWNNLAVAYRWMKRIDESIACYERALRIRPDYGEALTNLGNLLVRNDRIQEGLDYLSRAIVLRPANSQPRALLAIAYARLGRLEEAAKVYRDWIAAEPNNPTPVHLLAACPGEVAPERAADAYVARSFDAFADTFDAKLARLDYCAPELVAKALAQATPADRSYGVVLDAGCGTGLCAPLLRKRADRLIGVDLSGGMLAKAKERGGYDELHEAELTAFLAANPSAYDVAISADTLCYFGVLTDFARAAFDSLRPGGLLVFTVEALPDDSADPHRLQSHGRYAHRRSYVEDMLVAAGFVVEDMVRDRLRTESAKPVSGWIVTARRP